MREFGAGDAGVAAVQPGMPLGMRIASTCVPVVADNQRVVLIGDAKDHDVGIGCGRCLFELRGQVLDEVEQGFCGAGFVRIGGEKVTFVVIEHTDRSCAGSGQRDHEGKDISERGIAKVVGIEPSDIRAVDDDGSSRYFAAFFYFSGG